MNIRKLSTALTYAALMKTADAKYQPGGAVICGVPVTATLAIGIPGLVVQPLYEQYETVYVTENLGKYNCTLDNNHYKSIIKRINCGANETKQKEFEDKAIEYAIPFVNNAYLDILPSYASLIFFPPAIVLLAIDYAIYRCNIPRIDVVPDESVADVETPKGLPPSYSVTSQAPKTSGRLLGFLKKSRKAAPEPPPYTQEDALLAGQAASPKYGSAGSN